MHTIQVDYSQESAEYYNSIEMKKQAEDIEMGVRFHSNNMSVQDMSQTGARPKVLKQSVNIAAPQQRRTLSYADTLKYGKKIELKKGETKTLIAIAKFLIIPC